LSFVLEKSDSVLLGKKDLNPNPPRLVVFLFLCRLFLVGISL